MYKGEFGAFFQEFGWSVCYPRSFERVSPKINVTVDDLTSIVFSLARKGYWGGNPTEIWNAPVEDVINAYNYEAFIVTYQETEMLINEENNG